MPLNLIVICVDSWRADIIGPGKKFSWIDTPVLDALARDSVVFDSCWGEGQPTVQMRRSFFTGMRSYPWHHNEEGQGLSPPVPGWHRIPACHTTLAETLLSYGYCTGLVTDIYHLFKPGQNFTRGFVGWRFIRGQQGDNYRVGPLDDLDISRYVPDGEEHEWVRNKHVVTHLLNTRGRSREEDYFAPQVFGTASEWLHEAASNRPFFLWVDSFMPHELWDPPANYADRYFRNDGSLKDLIYPGVLSRIQDPSEALIRRTMALYAGCCTLVDTWIGHFLETLDKLRLWDDTLLMFVTDHGTELMDHGEFTKWGAWEGKLHPYNTKLEWFIRHPNGMRGVHVDGLVQSHDLTPTVLDILGIAGSELWDGRSAWPLVTGAAESIRERIITGWGRWASVRDCEWNCIIDPTKPDGTPRLFHLVRDPDENRDVASQYPEVVAEHRRYLEGLLGAPLPIRYKHQPDQGEYMTFASYLKRRGDAAGVLQPRAPSQVAPPADPDTLGLRSAAA